MTGFVFYDFETTGKSPVFDQALQFAAIYTDEDFLEIERVNIRSRLLPYITRCCMLLLRIELNRLAGTAEDVN